MNTAEHNEIERFKHRDDTEIVRVQRDDGTTKEYYQSKYDAIRRYDKKQAKIFVRISPELKDEFTEHCKELHISTNEMIKQLIEKELGK